MGFPFGKTRVLCLLSDSLSGASEPEDFHERETEKGKLSLTFS